MLQGQRRIRVDELSTINSFLGQSQISNQQSGRTQGEADTGATLRTSPVPNVDLGSIQTEGLLGEKDFPIYTSAQGGAAGMVVTFEPIEYVRRPEPLIGVSGAFGMYVVGDSMEPAFEQGDMLLVHPHKPPRRGDDVMLVKIGANGEHDAMVKRLVAMDGERVRVKQYNPPQEFDVRREELQHVYLIVGSYRRR